MEDQDWIERQAVLISQVLKLRMAIDDLAEESGGFRNSLDWCQDEVAGIKMLLQEKQRKADEVQNCVKDDKAWILTLTDSLMEMKASREVMDRVLSRSQDQVRSWNQMTLDFDPTSIRDHSELVKEIRTRMSDQDERLAKIWKKVNQKLLDPGPSGLADQQQAEMVTELQLINQNLANRVDSLRQAAEEKDRKSAEESQVLRAEVERSRNKVEPLKAENHRLREQLRLLQDEGLSVSGKRPDEKEAPAEPDGAALRLELENQNRKWRLDLDRKDFELITERQKVEVLDAENGLLVDKLFEAKAKIGQLEAKEVNAEAAAIKVEMTSCPPEGGGSDPETDDAGKRLEAAQEMLRQEKEMHEISIYDSFVRIKNLEQEHTEHKKKLQRRIRQLRWQAKAWRAAFAASRNENMENQAEAMSQLTQMQTQKRLASEGLAGLHQMQLIHIGDHRR